METKGYTRYASEREINLASMFFYVLKGWKLGVLAIVLGLILGIALGAYKDSRPYEPKEEEELLQIENMKNRYKSYQQTVKERNDGYLTTLDADKEYYYGSVVYYISAENESDTTFLGNMLNITNTSDYLYDVRDRLGISEDVYISSLSSLLNGSFTMYSANSGVNVSLNERTEKEVGYGLLTYDFSYLEKNQIENLQQYVEEKMAEIAASQAAAYTYTMEKFRSTVLPYTSDVVLSAQSSINAANLNDLVAFNDYLDELAKTEKGNGEATFDYENMVQQFKVAYLDAEKPSSIKKLAVLGAAGLFVLWGVVMVCRFLFCGCIFSEDELSQGYGLQVLGVVAGDSKKGMDGKVYSSVEYLADSLGLFKKECMVLGVVGKSALLLKTAETLQNGSKGSVLAGNLLTDADVLTKACANEGLVLMASLGHTKHSEIAAVLEVCSAHQLSVYGVIAVNEK